MAELAKTLGPATHHHNLTLFPLRWPQPQEPPHVLLSKAIEAGEAVVEEASEDGSVPNLAVTNRATRPLLIPEGEILVGAKQNRVINVTVLVAAGVKFALSVSCVEAGRWRYQSRQFESKFCAPPSLRNKKLRAVQKNRAAGGRAASDQGEVWDEVQACLDGVAAQSKTASLTDGFISAEEKLKEHRERFSLPEDAAGVLVGRGGRIVGMDLFDSPETLKTLWGRLSDAYFFDALRDPKPAPPTTADCAQRFIERLGGVARPRVPALGMGEELEITAKGMVTELAPVDLVLQRVGRLHRHRRDRRPISEPQLWIIRPPEDAEAVPEFGPNEWVYERNILLRSYATLRTRPYLRIPDDIETLVESVYSDAPLPDIQGPWQRALEESRQQMEMRRQECRRMADSILIRQPMWEDDLLEDFCRQLEEENADVHRTLQAATRLAEPTIALVLLYEIPGGLSLTADGEQPVSLDHEPAPTETRHMLEASVILSHPACVRFFASQEPPAAWRRNALLRYHRVAVLDRTGEAMAGDYRLQLDPELGIVIDKPDLAGNVEP